MSNLSDKEKSRMFDQLMVSLSPKKKAPKRKFDHEAAVLKYKALLIKSGFTKQEAA